MQVIQAPRASAILYSLIKNRRDTRPWLLPANICPVVPITFLKAEIPFVFVDISAETLHMDLKQAWASIESRRFGGVLYAHTYGEASTPNDFFSQIKLFDKSILTVDDRCLCTPDLQPGVDNLADVQLYSTGYAKIVDLGFGGYAFLKDEYSYKSIHLPFSQHHHDQMEADYKKAISDHLAYEYKDRDWLETDAEIMPWQEYSRQIEDELRYSLDRCNELNAIYSSHLPVELQLPKGFQTWRFNILVENKSDLLTAIFDAGLFASSHYASLAGIMSDGKCSQAETLHNQIINLFNDRHVDATKAAKICDVILYRLA